jgi:hypothetical protein
MTKKIEKMCPRKSTSSKQHHHFWKFTVTTFTMQRNGFAQLTTTEKLEASSNFLLQLSGFN